MEQSKRGVRPALLLCLLVVMLSARCQAQLVSCETHHNDPCQCSYGNGKGIDLTKLKNVPAFLDNSTRKYIWSPCGEIINFPGTECTKGAAACQIETSTDIYSIGKLSSATYEIDTSVEVFTAHLNYSEGAHERRMHILMVCSPSELPGSLTFNGEHPTLTYNFLLTSPAVCETSVSSGGASISAGSITLIAAVVLLFLYLAIGTIYMHAAKEAQGLQKIPNFAFWMALPGLIKDGAKCLVSPCTGGGVSGGSNYEAVP